jgi:hypothetical protein
MSTPPLNSPTNFSELHVWAIQGPTPEFVRWSIDFNCSIREPIGSFEPQKTERYLRPLAAIGDCLSNGRVIDEICLVEPALDGDAFRACFLQEVAEFYGWLEPCRELCGPCPANVQRSSHPNADHRGSSCLAGCFGWLVRNEDLVRRIESSIADSPSRTWFCEPYHRTDPAWYGLWFADKLEGDSLDRFGTRFDEVLGTGCVPGDWRRFSQALTQCRGSRGTLSVQFVPAGRVTGTDWWIGPYCPRCRAPQDSHARQCSICGRQGQCHPPIRRKAIGHRPFVKIESLVGPAKADQLVKHWAQNKTRLEARSTENRNGES